MIGRHPLTSTPSVFKYKQILLFRLIQLMMYVVHIIICLYLETERVHPFVSLWKI